MVDAVVIGAGPAGLTAHMQLQRSGVDSILLEAKHVGGLVRNAERIENYPGFPDGIDGKTLVSLFADQLGRFGTPPIPVQVVSVCRVENKFVIETDGAAYHSRSIIVTSGTKPVPFPGIIDHAIVNRIYYEVAELTHINSKVICVIGGGDAAFDYSLQLAKRDCSVHILIRGSKATCLEKLHQRVVQDSRISVHYQMEVSEIGSRKNRIELNGNKDLRTLGSPDYMLFAIGRTPNLGFLSSELREFVDGDVTTKLPGLFFAGDVIRKEYRQVGIAVGDGLMAAMACSRFLGKA